MDENIEVKVGAIDQLRAKGKAKQAMELYKQLIKLEGPNPRRTYCYQMVGVCYKMLRNNKAALNWLRLAQLNSKLSDENQGFSFSSLYRDLADVYSRRHRYQTARNFLELSLDAAQTAEERGMTLGFLGRNAQRQGKHEQALAFHVQANSLLEAGSNRSYELYNKLDLANALLRAGSRDKAVVIVRRAFLLSLDYGSWRHKVRLWVLRAGVYKIDSALRG